MTSIELMKILILTTAEIDDESFLKAIKTILDTQTQSHVLKLTKEVNHELAKYRKQTDQGIFSNKMNWIKNFING